MRFQRLALLSAIAFPCVLTAQKKEIVELQRDMALLQDQVRSMQRSLDEKMAALTLLTQQTLDSSLKANTAVAVLERQVGDRLKDQEKSLVAPVAGLGSKVDSMADEFRFVRESIADLNSKMGKLSTQVLDLGNAVKTMQSPVAPPPAGGLAGDSGAAAAPPPGVSADELYRAALRDKSGAKYDIALQQFQDYLRWFDNTEYAPNAQFHIGDIQFIKGDFEASIGSFTAVLEKYPENNNKAADAQFMKGRALVQLGQRTAAATEFKGVVSKFPNSEIAAKARTELKALGFSTSAPTTKKSKR